MMVLFPLTAVVGAILGLRFKAFVLAPATLLVSATSIATGVVGSHDARFIFLSLFAGLALLQMGYFIGCILHAYLTFGHKGRDRRTAWFPSHYL
jgi:hypothetical protein